MERAVVKFSGRRIAPKQQLFLLRKSGTGKRRSAHCNWVVAFLEKTNDKNNKVQHSSIEHLMVSNLQITSAQFFLRKSIKGGWRLSHRKSGIESTGAEEKMAPRN